MGVRGRGELETRLYYLRALAALAEVSGLSLSINRNSSQWIQRPLLAFTALRSRLTQYADVQAGKTPRHVSKEKSNNKNHLSFRRRDKCL